LLLAATTLPAQPGRRAAGVVAGRVVDGAFNTPVGYANVVLYHRADSVQVTGTITREDGRFRLTGIRPGRYFLSVRFIGYVPQTIDSLEVRKGRGPVRLGTIALQQTVLHLEGVESVAEQAPVEYHIDKKVINVSRQYTAASGTAVDVLENVPSVTVDIEGNVSLRGSSNFTVFIDGRPTVLEADEALKQIPAGAIENVEIITNPSARYEPDGTSGIINLVMKKGRMHGNSGVVNMNVGKDDKRGGDFLMQYRKRLFDASFGADYNKRIFPGSAIENNTTTTQNVRSFVSSDGTRSRGRTAYGLRGSLLFNPGKGNEIELGMRYGDRSGERRATLDYDQWSDLDPQHALYLSRDATTRSGTFYSGHLDYRHRFARKGHTLSARAQYHYRNSDESSTNELFDVTNTVTSGRKTTEDGPSQRLRLSLDYTLPLRAKSKFEAGFKSRLGTSKDVTGLLDYDPGQQTYLLAPQFSHTTDYRRDIHALYALFAGASGALGYQAGLRGEYTHRNIHIVDSGAFPLDRWDIFPTVHVSYDFSHGRQAMASYARRIQRSRGWYLEPFETWTDAYNVRTGNPALDPEYIDSFELGSQTHLGANPFSAELYYRITHNKVERVRRAYSENITLRTFENIGADYSLGTELMLSLDLRKWWNINTMGNLYSYRVEGELFAESFARRSFNWNVRVNSSIKLGRWTRLQFNAIYNSPTVSSQGRREGFFVATSALKQDLLPKKLSATLQVRDVLGTSKFESTSEGPGYTSYNYFSMDSPVVMLNLSYTINNYKPERHKREDDGDGEDDF